MTIDNRRYYKNELENTSKPLTYIEWLKYEQSFISETAFEQYNTYLHSWYSDKETYNTNTYKQQVRDSYIQLLKEITLNYTTVDEKRFLKNIDFTNNHDLDIALPFYSKKIKDIALYYSTQRESLHHSPIVSNLKGSNYGIEKILYKYIYELITRDEWLVEQIAINNLTVSTVLEHLEIDIEELYDTSQTYYNNDMQEPSQVLDTSTISHHDHNSFEEAVIEIIKKVPVYLQTGEMTITTGKYSLSVTEETSINEIDRLQDRNFENYTMDSPLNFQNEHALISKYSGTDYYYISSGETLNDTISGRAFEASRPHAYLLNKNISTIQYATTDTAYKEAYIGGFFVQDNIGLLTFATLDKTYNFNIKSGETLYFPNPDESATASFGMEYQNDILPVEYVENISWQKQHSTYQHNCGLQTQYHDLARFTGYSSSTQNNVPDNLLSFNFWENSPETIWKNQDIYELGVSNIQPLSSRHDELLSSQHNIHVWKTDIYGNTYALYKQHIPNKITTPKDISTGVYETKYNTSIDTDNNSAYANNISNKNFYKQMINEQKVSYGSIYVDNNTTTGTQTFEESLLGVFKKYDAGQITVNSNTYNLKDIQDELVSRVINLDIIYDILIISTENYIVIEKIVYDYDNCTLSSGQPSHIFIDKDKTDSLNQTGEWFFIEDTNTIIFTQSKAHTVNRKKSYKTIYPTMYGLNINSVELQQIFPVTNKTSSLFLEQIAAFDTSQLNSQFDIIRTKPPTITYNKDSERFILTQLCYDPSDNLYYYTMQCRILNNRAEYITVDLYKPEYTVFCENFYNDQIRDKYFTQNNPSNAPGFHDSANGIYFLGSTPATNNQPVAQTNNAAIWTYGSAGENFSLERDLTVYFEFAMYNVGTPGPTPDAGIGVILYNARDTDNLKLGTGQSTTIINNTTAEAGGTGTAFSYLADSHTTTFATLTGLDHGYVASVLDLSGSFAISNKAPNSLVVRGPDGISSAAVLHNKPTNINLLQHITSHDHLDDLQFMCCKVTLTDLGRKLVVKTKLSNELEYSNIDTIDITTGYPSSYSIPKRLKPSITFNTGTTPCFCALRRATVTGSGNISIVDQPIGYNTSI